MDLYKASFILLFMGLSVCSKTKFSSNGQNEQPSDDVILKIEEEASENEKTLESGESNQAPIITSTPIESHSFYSQVSQESMLLQAEVRDFKKEHPDFESYMNEIPVDGLVNSQLGEDGVPQFVGINGQFITSAETFAQWYKDVPGVNQKLLVNLELQKDGQTSTYRYINDEFFPIDNIGFGNEGYNHNFHFTLKVATTFTYKGGEVFTFKGDDDVWVFIANKLVVDLGGVHSEATKSVNLDSLTLELGKDYPFVLFFAERHTIASHFKMETTIQLNNLNKSYEYQVEASDPDGDELIFSLEMAPPGLEID